MIRSALSGLAIPRTLGRRSALLLVPRAPPVVFRSMSSLSVISTTNAPAALGPYSQAIKSGPFVFVSGSIPLVPETGEIVEGGIKEQTTRVLQNMKAVVEASGTTISKVVKTTVFLKSMNDFGEMNPIYENFFEGHKPARSTVEVSRLPKDVMIEIECIAAL